MAKMKYGQYRDVDYQEIPTAYLQYILSEAERTVFYVKKELARRKASETGENFVDYHAHYWESQ